MYRIWKIRSPNPLFFPLLALLFVFTASAYSFDLPDSYLIKVDTTPDLRQSLAAAHLPYGGDPYCGPVAVSNSLVWLSRNGFNPPRVRPEATHHKITFKSLTHGQIVRGEGRPFFLRLGTIKREEI
jgi:hypothetical protein